MTDLHSHIRQLLNGRPLSAKDAESLFGEMLAGRVSSIETAAILGALAGRGETVGEITGAVMAMRRKSIPIDAPEGVIDCCGTGGDHAGTVNISTAVSFVVAGCGVPVAKHGNRASSSKSGAADVLEALGLDLDSGPLAAHTALREAGICFLMAPAYNPAAKHVAPVRQELKARTIFNLLGPLLNPAGAKRQLIGVYDPKWCKPVAEVLKRLGSEHAWVVHGQDGLDEITTTAKTTVVELKNGVIREFEIHPHDLDIGVYDRADLKGGNAQENAEALHNLLKGETGAYRDIVVFNAAAALVVAGKADTLRKGAELARRSLDSGAALEKLEALIRIYNE